MNRSGLVVFAALAACHHGHAGTAPPPASALFDEVEVVTQPGMSDLSSDDKGTLWGIAERDPAVVELSLAGAHPVTHTLQGQPPGVDTEAIVALGGGKFAIGIEGENDPTAGVLTAELQGNVVVVTGTQNLDDKQLGVTLRVNHGVEALCGRDGELLAAIETVGETEDHRRWAPIVRIRGDEMKTAKLWLTSDNGKISAMTCTIAEDGRADVTAIERHYGIVRILKFTIGRDDTEVTPRLALDLFPILHDRFNLEGITRLPDGRYVAINDNQMATVSGPTKLLVFRPDAIR